MLRVRTFKDVALFSLLITAIALAAVAAFVHLAIAHRVPTGAYRVAMLLATGLPIVIAMPISALALSMARFITLQVDKLEALVKFDPLTGVLVRSYFMDSVHQRFGEGGAFMLIDADRFKDINDTFGHDFGDEALRTIGRVLNGAAPATAIVGRLGGEEFGMFIPGVTDLEARTIAEASCAAIRAEGRMAKCEEVNLTISIGVAPLEDRATMSQIYKEADDALYRAKRNGRDRHEWSSRAIASPASLRRAVA